MIRTSDRASQQPSPRDPERIIIHHSPIPPGTLLITRAAALVPICNVGRAIPPGDMQTGRPLSSFRLFAEERTFHFRPSLAADRCRRAPPPFPAGGVLPPPEITECVDLRSGSSSAAAYILYGSSTRSGGP